MNNMLSEYARLLVEVGLNVQKGQYVLINSPISCADFTRRCVDAAYAAGACDVLVNWGDDYVSRQHWLNADDSVFDNVFSWDVDKNLGYAKLGAARLSISASDPENLKGVDPSRMERASKASGEANKEFHEMMMTSAFPWCVASIPVPSWAKKVFPELPEDEAMEKLWESIFSAVRITPQGGAVERWREHCDYLKQKREALNNFNFKFLHYTNSIGTDLMIELPENHIWMAGSEYSKNGIEFVANMPTEEVFTAPKLDGVNGKVVASMPLVEGGNIINNFYMIIKDGVIVEVHAEQGEEYLKQAIALDEGASRLGEVALVPFDSPISNSGILFYNTLFDENASCHLAFGAAYPCVKNGENMTAEELTAAGLNNSIQHCDFMIGTSDLSIVGITHDGREVPVFVDGNFAI